jgi:nitrous oxidase accessory protein NosD
MAIRTGARPLIVSGCTFANNKGRALYIWNGRVSFFNNTLTNNNIALYAWHGTCEVYQNIIANNSVGIEFAPGCSNCTVNYNNFNNNGIGIQLDQFPPHPEYTIGEQNKVYSNNFYRNQKQVAIVSMGEYDANVYVGTDIISWTEAGIGNYWSDYSGNGEYVIAQRNVDYHPLSQQADIGK